MRDLSAGFRVYLLCFVALVVGFLVLLMTAGVSMAAESRAIRRVKVRTSSGATKEIRLYSGCYALVVGCGDYRKGWPRLPNPVKDAREVAAALKGMGWKVDLLEDPDGDRLETALNRLITGPGRVRDKAVLFWFSGHGHTLEEADGTKLGYIVPVDAPRPSQDEMGFMKRAIDMRQVETVAKRIRAKHVLMVFDSCFSGAIFAMVRAAPSDYIQEKVAAPVREFITAGRENEQVPDRSVFKTCFIQGVKEAYADLNRDGYVTGEELGSYLQEKVVNYSRKAQHPQFGKINNPKLDKGDFVIMAGGAMVVEPAAEETRLGKKGSLRVKTEPSGAEVFVDGISKGRAPVTLDGLSPGKVKVKASLKGYRAQEETAYVRASRETSLSLVLGRIVSAGSVTVRSDPSGAKWYLDGAYAGTTPDEIKEVKPGSHEVAVKKKGYKDWTKDVRVQAGERSVLSARLQPVGAAPGETFTNSLGMKFMYIKPGTFMMGSPSSEPGRENDETQHRVTLTRGFYMQTTEVTVGQWRSFVRDTGYKSEAETGGGAYVITGSKWEKKAGYYWDNPGFAQKDSHPVTCVSWNDAQAFIRWLNGKEEKAYRLPTEAEWEYAARAGSTTARFWGDDADDACGYANVHDRTSKRINRFSWTHHECDDGYAKTVPAGSFKPNAFGLYDMLGNVWEWCEDWFGKYFSGSVTDPEGARGGSFRVIRGGSWVNWPRNVRCADRIRRKPAARGDALGFRLVRPVK